MKKRYKIANNMFAIGFILWILKIVVFLIIGGLESEKIVLVKQVCDNVITVIWIIAFYLWFTCLSNMLDVFIETLPDEKKENDNEKK